MTDCRPQTTSSQVGSISGGQWLGLSALLLSYNHQIFARSKIKTTTPSPDLSKNFISSSNLSKYRSKSTTSSLDLGKIFISPPDLSKKTQIFTRSNQKLPNLHRNIDESKWIQVNPTFFHGFRRSDQVYRVLKKKTRHSTHLKSIFGGEDPSPTITGVESASFWVSSSNLGGWVDFWVPVDTAKVNLIKYQKYISQFKFILYQYYNFLLLPILFLNLAFLKLKF